MSSRLWLVSVRSLAAAILCLPLRFGYAYQPLPIVSGITPKIGQITQSPIATPVVDESIITKSWIYSFTKYQQAISIPAPNGYVLKNAPSFSALDVPIKQMDSTLLVVGHIDIDGQRFYMTEWSWSQYNNKGKNPNWVLLSKPNPVEIPEPVNYPDNTATAAEAEEPAPPDLVEVVATGMGIDANSALLNAYSNAVQQALGLYVDAETMVQNDQIVQDQILTYSKGFIETAQQVSSSNANGLFQVKIRAKVKRQELMEKAKASNITSVKTIDGASLHAQIVSKEQQKKDVLPLLKKAIDQFANTDMIRAELVGEPTVEAGEGDSVGNTILTYTVVLSVDEAVYKTAANELTAVLDQIASKKTEFVGDTDAASRGDRNNPDFWFKENSQFDQTDYIRLNVLTWHSRNFASFKMMGYVFTGVNKNGFGNYVQPMPTVYLSLLDANGDPLAVSSLGLSDFRIRHNKYRFGTVKYNGSNFIIRPYSLLRGMEYNWMHPKYSFTTSISISDEDLPLLKSAKIELKR